jgi:hypothetical protein
MIMLRGGFWGLEATRPVNSSSDASSGRRPLGGTGLRAAPLMPAILAPGAREARRTGVHGRARRVSSSGVVSIRNCSMKRSARSSKQTVRQRARPRT